MPNQSDKFAEQVLGSLCEIKSESNDLLMVVRLESIDENDRSRFNFVNHNKGDKLPLLAYNTPVKILSFSGKDGFILLRGNVYISTADLLSLVEVHSAQGYERRRYFRLNTRTTANAILQNSDEDEQPFVVDLYDISLGGVRIGSRRELYKNDILLTSFTLMDRKLEFCCRVCREMPDKKLNPQIHQYGCEFVNFNNRQLDQLCSILFKIQRLEIQKRKRNRYE